MLSCGEMLISTGFVEELQIESKDDGRLELNRI
jgi:hypothetical protein